MTIPRPQPDEPAAAAAAERFIRNARPDLWYGVFDLPVGTVLAARSDRGLVRLGYDDLNGGVDGLLADLARRVSPSILAGEDRFDDLRRELDEYFAGNRTEFDVELDWTLVGAFGRSVLQATAAIPYGEVSTYKEIAADAGRPAASRATGNALGANPLPILIPCHRVLRSGGGLGGYTGGLHRKQALLELEARR